MFKSIGPILRRALPRSTARTQRFISTGTKGVASGKYDAALIFASFAGLTLAFSTAANSVKLRLESAAEPESQFLYATGGKIKDYKGPVYSRDEATVVMIIGGPKGGKTGQAKRIERRFDMMLEEADSDIYSDIALNLPTAHLMSPSGSSKVRVVVDDFARTSKDPLDQALQFEADVAPILLFIFVDCPLSDALLRVSTPEEKEALKLEYADFEKRMTPLIKHYRDKANFLEITGQWPADEMWEQVEAKLESALELESRGDL